MAERDAEMMIQMGLKPTLLVNTHVHADHITGTGKLKNILPGTKSVISKVSGGQADVKVSEGDKISFGSRYGSVVDWAKTIQMVHRFDPCWFERWCAFSPWSWR